MAVGTTVLVDSGLIRLEVLSAAPDRVRCRVTVPAKLGSRRHINLPGVKVRLPALTAKDRADITVGWRRRSTTLPCPSCGRPTHRHPAPLPDGHEEPCEDHREDRGPVRHRNLDEIIVASDAVMVARGDLGIEVPMEDLPLIQKRMVDGCIQHRKPVIVATHLLESHDPLTGAGHGPR